MARFAVISAMPVELKGLLEKFGAEERFVKGFYRLYEGFFEGHKVVLACCGVGKVNAAACTQHLIDGYHVDYVVNMGIAGGIDPSLRTLDVVVGSEVFYHDFTPPHLLNKYYPFAGRYACDEGLMRLAEQACDASGEAVRHIRGCVASGDSFVEEQQTKRRILEAGGVCCEMEGAAVGHVCHLSGVPFLVLRSISDLADEDAKMSYDEFEQKAARQANRIVEGMLRLMP